MCLKNLSISRHMTSSTHTSTITCIGNSKGINKDKAALSFQNRKRTKINNVRRSKIK